MTIPAFIAIYATSAGLIAMWINYRFPSLMPKSMGSMLIHMIASELSWWVWHPHTIVTLLVYGFICITYALLVAIWLMRLIQGSMVRR